jgi:hypothetical protein
MPEIEENIQGAADGKLFYTDPEEHSRIMTLDVQTGEEAFLVDYTDERKDGFAVFQDCILTCSGTDEGDNLYLTYTLYDLDGEKLGSFTDDTGYIYPMYQIGDYICYNGGLMGAGKYVEKEQLLNCKNAANTITVSE